MKSKHYTQLLWALTIAIASIATIHAEIATGTHLPPAPLPDFMTPAQLTKWRAEMTAKTVKQDALNASITVTASSAGSTPFYTGKPYIAETGGYAFKYREYNPAMARWTTVDPSGFPDGANNRLYVNNGAISSLDNNGLVRLVVTEDDSSHSAFTGTSENWSWTISHSGTTVASGTSPWLDANTVSHNVGTYAGLDDHYAGAGASMTYNFVTKVSGSWVSNGWSVTALSYERVGLSDSDAKSVNANSSVNSDAKQVSRYNIEGMTSFLANQLGSAAFSDHWYTE